MRTLAGATAGIEVGTVIASENLHGVNPDMVVNRIEERNHEKTAIVAAGPRGSLAQLTRSSQRKL